MGLKSLHIACGKGLIYTAAALLHVLDPNEKDVNGRTALYFAILEGYNNVIELLTSCGCKPGKCEYKLIATLELEHQLDVNARINSGKGKSNYVNKVLSK